jgi:predicted Zn finger-like uncharacterized protein
VNYRTTCPNCLSVFRLGADQLDAAQGWVQCSVCGSAFDARQSLFMEDGSPLPPPEPEPVEAILQPEIEPAAEQDTMLDAADTATPDAPPFEEAEDAIADTPRGIVQREATFDLDSIILIDPDIPVPDDPGPLPQIHTVPSYPPSPLQKPAASEAMPSARIEYAASPAPMPGLLRRPPSPRRTRPWVWGLASLLLLVALLAQTAYFLRDTLASRLPQTRYAFEQACDVLGCTLSLPKNIAQLQIVGSDLQTEASGRLKLTLTLGNRAGYVQAWPVLVLTLTDQHNRSLARRSFAPSEYLGDAQRIAAGIPPRSEQPLSLPLTVHKLTPMGFNLQLTY